MTSSSREELAQLSESIRQRVFDSIAEDTGTQTVSENENTDSLKTEEFVVMREEDDGVQPVEPEVRAEADPNPEYVAEDNVNGAESNSEEFFVYDDEDLDEYYCSDDEYHRLSLWQRLRISYLNLDFASILLYRMSFYAIYLSWAMFAVFIIGRFAQNDVITMVGVIGSMASVFVSIVGDELACKLNRSGRKWFGVIVIAAALVLLGCGIYGIATNDNEFITGGVLGMFALSFLPWLYDSMDSSLHDDYVYVEHHHSSNGGYNVLADAFGIPQPQDPPPIEVSRDGDLDDEWMEYLNHRIELANVEIAPVCDAAQVPTGETSDADEIQALTR